SRPLPAALATRTEPPSPHGGEELPLALPLESEADGVLADRDLVAVGQLAIDHRLSVDQRPVGAPQVADPEGTAACLDPAMVARCGRVAHDHIVVGGTADADHLVREGHDPARERAALECEERREA